MPRFRTIPWLAILAGGLLLPMGAAPAQEQSKPEAAAETPKDNKAAWPPADAEKHVIKADESHAKGLVLYTPKTWKKGEPDNRIRLAEFDIPPAEGDEKPIELTVFSFGAGGGGGVRANVERWINQFQAQGRKVKVTKAEGHQGLYVLVDVSGTYNMPDGPPILQKTKPLPDARMLAVIIGIRWNEEQGEGDAKKTVEKSAVYFLKMAGPEKTVSANEDAFRKAIGADRSKEEPLEVRAEPAE